MLKSEGRLDTVFRALGDRARRAILEHLSRGEATMSELAAPLGVTLSAVHQHISVLQEAGLVACEKRGRVRWCSLNVAGLNKAEAWIRDRKRLWDGRLDSLARYLARESAKPVRPRRQRGGKE
jgi:DNA-binding transcriptional ArsR family regulator